MDYRALPPQDNCAEASTNTYSSGTDNMILFGDIETYSAIDLKQVGAQAYARHPSTEVTLFAWAVDNGPIQVWDCTKDFMPNDLAVAFNDADEYVFHNAAFDRTVLLNNLYFLQELGDKGCWLDERRFHCTMIRAMAHSLPGALGTLCELYGLQGDEAKDKDGRRLVMMFCKPDKNGVRKTRETHPEDWAKFVAYAGRDVAAMRILYHKLPRINTDLPAERALIDLDRRINDRGLYIDMDLVNGAIRAVDREQERLRHEVQDKTDDMVESATKGAQLLAYILEEFGVRLPDMQASTLERRLEDDSIPEPVKELLRIRLDASKSSTAKYKVLQRATTQDNRLRGLLQIYGASRTGRWSGRLYQPQNLRRSSEKFSVVERNIAALKADVLDLVASSVMESCSNAIRGAIISPPGKKLVVADLSNIEGRALVWLAGEEWKLKAFRDFDTLQLGDGSWASPEQIRHAGLSGVPLPLARDKKGDPIRKGHDLYALAYAKAFGITPEEVMENKKTGDGVMRQVGKVMELACVAKDTLVLTKLSGWVKIEALSAFDRVWDGEEWVTHQGAICRGEKEVINLNGVEVTPDHLLLTKTTWQQASHIVSNESTLYRPKGPCSGTWSCSGPNTDPLEGSPTFWSNALSAEQMATVSAFITFVVESLLAAIPAQKSNPLTGGSSTTATLTFAQIKSTEDVFLTESRRQLTDAVTRTMAAVITTEISGYESRRSLKKTAELFWRTLSAFLGGTTRLWKWTELTSTKAMNLEIFALLRELKTSATDEKSGIYSRESMRLKKKTKTYDIAFCGPRNRFAILTSKGMALAHNCGYGGGAAAFLAFANVYRLDLPKMAERAEETIPPAILSEATDFYPFAKEKGFHRGMAEPVFVVCESLKRLWRMAHPNVVNFWSACENAFRDALASPGVVFHAGKIAYKAAPSRAWMYVRLPSGRVMCYPQPREERNGELTYMGVNQYTRKWERIKTYSGRLVENCCQAAARDVIASSMPVAEERGFEIVLTVHDELVTEAPDSDEFNADLLSAIMSDESGWRKGLPLAAAGYEGYRYRKD